MTLFIDASALVAMIAPESDAARIAQRLNDDEDRVWSPLSRWETEIALCRSYSYDPAAARAAVGAFAETISLRLVPIGEREAELASEAYARYGKGRHRAQLNMGDCFAYACAKANGASLLYKGQDFAETDLA